MAFWETREEREERRRIRNIEPVGSKRNPNVGNINRDRLRTALFIGTPIVGILALVSWIRQYGETPELPSRPASTSLPIPSNLSPDARPLGTCYLPDMKDPPQTRVLQEFLSSQAEDYYDGPLDGVYDQDVIDAVSEFQEDAKDDGVYAFEVDGIAGYYTCRAMGNPYFKEN